MPERVQGDERDSELSNLKLPSQTKVIKFQFSDSIKIKASPKRQYENTKI